jgi:hypothetical protein
MPNKTKKKMGRPRKAENWTAALLSERSREYFDKCDSRTKMVPVPKVGLEEMPAPEPYSIEGLCDYLDITRQQFYHWRKRNDELGIRAQKIHNKITANRITGALDGTQNSAFAQFLLKNNNPEDYKDKMEVENSVSEQAASMFQQWSEQWSRK